MPGAYEGDAQGRQGGLDLVGADRAARLGEAGDVVAVGVVDVVAERQRIVGRERDAGRAPPPLLALVGGQRVVAGEGSHAVDTRIGSWPLPDGCPPLRVAAAVHSGGGQVDAGARAARASARRSCQAGARAVSIAAPVRAKAQG